MGTDAAEAGEEVVEVVTVPPRLGAAAGEVMGITQISEIFQI